MTLAGLRRLLYAAARLLGDVGAAKQGPSGLGRRAVRRRAHRITGRTTARVLRSLGF